MIIMRYVIRIKNEESSMKRIVVVGAGAFGTALALAFLRAGHHVTLKPRRAEHAAELNSAGENRQYLAGVPLPHNLIIDDEHQCLAKAELVVLAIPVQQTPSILNEISMFLPSKVPFLVVSKGILTEKTLQTPFISDWIEQNIPDHPVFVLSGPNFAGEIARCLPAAATLAHPDPIAVKKMAESLWHTHFRLYPSTDRRGVEFCGAVKNVYAIACGICSGLNLGHNALATLITRCLAEIKRLGVGMGAQPDTFLGLSGVGDLMLTCTSTQSRNMSFGIELAKGRSVAEILTERKTVAEGIATSKALNDLVLANALPMRVANAVYSIVHQGVSVDSVISDLLSRHEVCFESE
ncbi:MAG: NAD(P)H-dependent glycerol-3-phosphate dehydrogenase [Pseudomonadota bacterium]